MTDTNTNSIKDLNNLFNSNIKLLKSERKFIKNVIFDLLDISLKTASMYQNTTQLNRLFLNDNVLSQNERVFCVLYLKTQGYIITKGKSNSGKDTVKLSIKKDCKPITLKSFLSFKIEKKAPVKKDFNLESHLDKLISSDKASLTSLLDYLKKHYDFEAIKQALL